MGQTHAALAGLAEIAAPPKPSVPLDELDVSLLRLLSSEARLSQRQLAVRLGVSAPTVGERMSRLERSGVIRGYAAQIDWEVAGFGVRVYMSITAAPGYDLTEIMRGLWNVPEVEDLLVVTGSLDMLAALRVRDHGHLRTVLMQHVWQIPGLQGSETLIGMAEMPPKPFAADLLDTLRDGPSEAFQTAGEQ
jgi:Lrp/AsnC family transcriptional regulator, leucine-responsive regulatory protein